MPIASRLTNAGTLLVNGSFDENTSIAPSKFRTTSNTVFATTLDEVSLAAGSVSFSGSSQWLDVDSTLGSSAFTFGTGDVTIECWVYHNTISGTQNYYRTQGSGANAAYLFRQTSGTLEWAVYNAVGTNLMQIFSATGALVANTWYHVAAVRYGNIHTIYINGQVSGTPITVSYSAPATQQNIGIGRGDFSFSENMNGYISNLRVVKGTAIYTTNFATPTGILPAVANTSLLLNVTNAADFIKDNGPNKFTVTNNSATFNANGPFNQGVTAVKQRQVTDGTQEVSTQFDEFTGAPVLDPSLMVWIDAGQTASYSGSGATWTDLSSNAKNYTLANSPTFNSITGGGVITFAGASSQYATAATTLFNSTTTNTYSINIWVYPTGAGQTVQVDGQSTPNTAYHYTAIEITAAGLIYFGQWTGSMTTIITSAQSLNAWYNLAITYNGTTATAYVNGASVGSSAIAWSAPGASTFFGLMAQDATNMSGTAAYASGSIGAFMVYNRALSADEVTTNFNALRGRYGI